MENHKIKNMNQPIWSTTFSFLFSNNFEIGKKEIKEKIEKPTLTIEQYLDAVFGGEYDENKIKEIKRWKKK